MKPLTILLNELVVYCLEIAEGKMWWVSGLTQCQIAHTSLNDVAAYRTTSTLNYKKKHFNVLEDKRRTLYAAFIRRLGG